MLIVVTNQLDDGRSDQRLEVVEQMHAHMLGALPLDRVEVCSDPAPEGSPCYKPAPGLFLRATAELDLDLSRSYTIGDRWRDVDCGYAAGCTTIYIDRGYREDLRRQPPFHASCLMEASEIILRDCEKS